MKFTLFHLFAVISVALVGSHATTSEEYWKSVLPNTPMPKALKDLLYSTELNHEKNTNGDVAAVTAGKTEQAPDVGVGTGGIGVHYRHRGQPGSVGVRPDKNPFLYNYAASKDQLKDDPNVALFFLEKDLHQGRQMNLHFTKNNPKSTFLPRKTANSIPFSLKNLPQIYNYFGIKPHSMEAKEIKQTLSECNNKGIDGEEKFCVTSLESMIDFVTTKLGKRVKAVSTEVDAKESTPLQKYKIELARKVISGNIVVVCHKESYPYAVFYCHKTDGTRAYEVSMVGDDGMKVNAVAVCHIDTGKWNPKHLAFQVLKVKPGSVPVCHFLPEDHVVWST